MTPISSYRALPLGKSYNTKCRMGEDNDLYSHMVVFCYISKTIVLIPGGGIYICCIERKGNSMIKQK